MFNVEVFTVEYTPAATMLVNAPAPTFSCHCIVGAGLPPVVATVNEAEVPVHCATGDGWVLKLDCVQHEATETVLSIKDVWFGEELSVTVNRTV